MSIEILRSSDVRDETVTFSEARQVVWRAGGMALDHTVEAHRGIVASELSNMFSVIDQASSDADIMIPILPDNEVPKITIGSLLDRVDRYVDEIYSQQALLHDGPVNPFACNDNRLNAFEGVKLYIVAAYNGMRDDQCSMN